ncbi:hypothetical protein ABEB36_003898, partial [Hypothenemus hampei]
MFSIREYHDMLLIYGKALQNFEEVRRIYGHRYPERQLSKSSKDFKILTAAVFEAREQILNLVDEDSTRSTYPEYCAPRGVSSWSVLRTLKKQLLYAYQ